MASTKVEGLRRRRGALEAASTVLKGSSISLFVTRYGRIQRRRYVQEGIHDLRASGVVRGFLQRKRVGDLKHPITL